MKINFHSQPKEPERDDGIKVSYAPAKRTFPKFRWYLILLVVSSPLIYFIFNVLMNNVLVQGQGFVSLKLVEIRSSRHGYLSQIFVKPWDTVEKEQLIASLTGDDIEAGADATATRISLLRKSVELAQTQVNEQEKRLHAMEALFDDGAATAAEVSAAKRSLETSTYLLYTKLTEQDAEHSIQVSNAVSRNSLSSNGLPVMSPTSGRVVEIHAVKNAYLSAGDTIMVVAEPGEPLVTAYLDPKYSKYARIGQKATVKFTDGKAYLAHIVELPKVTKKLPVEFTSAFGTRPLSVLVRLALEDPLPEDHQIHGLPVWVRFHSDLEALVYVFLHDEETHVAKLD